MGILTIAKDLPFVEAKSVSAAPSVREQPELTLEGFVDEALGLIPDILVLGDTIPVSSASDIDPGMYSVKERLLELDTKGKKLAAEIKIRLPSQNIHSLSSRIIGHDLRNILTPYTLGYERFLKIGKINALNTALYGLINYRLICMSIGFLISNGNQKYLTEVPVSQIPHLLDISPEQFEKDATSPKTISSIAYFSLMQLVKNAETYAHGKYKVSITSTGDFIVITVKDHGNGIRSKDGAPMLQHELGDIFGDYSTRNGGGLGLQLVDRAIRSIGGYITLATKSPNEPERVYCIKNDRNVQFNKQCISEGTQFQLYIPKRSLK